MAKSPKNGNGATAETETKEKVQKASMTYRNAEGKEWNFPNSEATIVRTTFADETTYRDLAVSDLSSDMLRCAELLGLSKRIQASYGNEKDPDKCVEAVDGVIEDLLGGVWIAPRGGPRVMIVAKALKRVLDASNDPVDDARFDAIVGKLKSEEPDGKTGLTFMEKAMKSTAVVAAIETIKLENATARAKAAKAAAKDDAAGLGF